MKKRVFLAIFLCLTIVFSFSGDKEKRLKTWKMPNPFRENIQFRIDQFNRQIESLIKSYAFELTKNYKGFSDMPPNVKYDHETGLLFKPEDLEAYNKDKQKAIDEIRQQIQPKPEKKEKKK